MSISLSVIVSLLLAGIFTDNMILTKFFGICPFLGVSKKVGTAVSMGIAVTVVMVIASAVTYPIYALLLYPEYDYLQTIVFILVIAALVQLLEIIIKKTSKSLYNALGIYLPLITTNCAVLGITILNCTDFPMTAENYVFSTGYVYALVNSLGAGLGFLLGMFIFSGVRERLESANIPKSLKGLPITLVSAALVSLSFIGFSGL